MALSNWDTLALDRDGRSVDGTFSCDDGVSVEVYKNWLYVRDPAGWREGGAYVEPTVAQVTSGRVTYRGLTMHATRGPQEGVYVVAHHGPYFTPGSPIMLACGVSGYDEDSQWVGVQPESLAFLQQWFLQWRDEWVGNDDMPALAGSLDGAQRFNQGDAFFAAAAGVQTPATPVGEAEETILSRLVAEPE